MQHLGLPFHVLSWRSIFSSSSTIKVQVLVWGAPYQTFLSQCHIQVLVLCLIVVAKKLCVCSQESNPICTATTLSRSSCLCSDLDVDFAGTKRKWKLLEISHSRPVLQISDNLSALLRWSAEIQCMSAQNWGSGSAYSTGSEISIHRIQSHL